MTRISSFSGGKKVVMPTHRSLIGNDINILKTYRGFILETQGKIFGIDSEVGYYLGDNISVSYEDAELVTIEELKENHGLKFKPLLKLDENLVIEERTSFGSVNYKPFKLTYTLEGMKDIRKSFFRDYLGVNDPFLDHWIVKNKKNLNLGLDYVSDIYFYMNELLHFYDNNPMTAKYRDSFLNLKYTLEGQYRKVKEDFKMNVVYKVLKDEGQRGQHSTEVFYSLKYNNPMYLPLLSMFAVEGVVVLVYPKVEKEVKFNSSSHLVSFIREFVGDDSIAYVEGGCTCTYEGVLMYRGSESVGLYNGIPFFYDLGECRLLGEVPYDTESLVSDIPS